MAIAVGNVSHPKLQGLRLRQYYISSITDGDTITLGTPGIKEVAVRTGSGSATNAYIGVGTGTETEFSGVKGTLAATRRVAAHLTNAADGTITLYAPSAASTCILMVWSAA